MIRATTPTHKFTVPFDPEQTREILLTYAQRGKIVLERRKEELSFTEENEEHVITTRMTQEETALFQAGFPVEIQMRVLSAAEDALASDKITVRVEDVLNDEVLT